MDFETVIGLEAHVELATATKIFCSCSTKFGADKNTQCCPICMGFPGTLPLLNGKVLEYAIKAGLALNCEITRRTVFDRKNYFYPDLPKAYQISQLYFPLARNGRLDIETPIKAKEAGKMKTRTGTEMQTGSETQTGTETQTGAETQTEEKVAAATKVSSVKKRIRIREIHMEEDAGKLIHSQDKNESYPDYNRCGIPLIEIVSESDFRNAAEVISYLEKLRLTLRYLGISDCKMQEGSMRVDVNLSVRKIGEALGTRTEMKNLNSFKAIERAIEYESERQKELLKNGEKVIQETRRWDDNKGKSFAMRTKEEAKDYRYFPEPDILPVNISEELLKKLADEQPELSDEKKERYMRDFGLSEYDARQLISEKELACLFEKTVDLCGAPKETANWITGSLMYEMNEKGVEPDKLKVSPGVFAEFIRVIKDGKINNNTGKEIFRHVFEGGDDFDVNAYISEKNLAVINDDTAILNTVRKILSENTKTVEEYKSGKTKVFGFLVGQCMKEMKGKANPEKINKIIKSELDAYKIDLKFML